jgi:hypothetical protein
LIPPGYRSAIVGRKRADSGLGEPDEHRLSASEEIAMNPTTDYDLSQAQLAELHRQGQRDALATAARRSNQPDRPAYRPSGLLAVLARLTQRRARASAP